MAFLSRQVSDEAALSLRAAELKQPATQTKKQSSRTPGLGYDHRADFTDGDRGWRRPGRGQHVEAEVIDVREVGCGLTKVRSYVAELQDVRARPRPIQNDAPAVAFARCSTTREVYRRRGPFQRRLRRILSGAYQTAPELRRTTQRATDPAATARGTSRMPHT